MKIILRTRLKLGGQHYGLLVMLRTTQEVWRKLVTFPLERQILPMDGASLE